MALQNPSDNVPAVQSFAPTTGTTVTVANDTTHDILVALTPSGALVALTIAMPTPWTGQRVYISSTQAITTVTMTSGATIVGAVTTLATGGGNQFMYDGSAWRQV